MLLNLNHSKEKAVGKEECFLYILERIMCSKMPIVKQNKRNLSATHWKVLDKKKWMADAVMNHLENQHLYPFCCVFMQNTLKDHSHLTLSLSPVSQPTLSFFSHLSHILLFLVLLPTHSSFALYSLQSSSLFSLVLLSNLSPSLSFSVSPSHQQPINEVYYSPSTGDVICVPTWLSKVRGSVRYQSVFTIAMSFPPCVD